MHNQHWVGRNRGKPQFPLEIKHVNRKVNPIIYILRLMKAGIDPGNVNGKWFS